MSGSALLTSSNIVLGVHNVELITNRTNGAIVLSARTFDSVYQWAGLATQTPLDCQTKAKVCPCAQFAGNRRQRVICWIRNYEECLASLQNRAR